MRRHAAWLVVQLVLAVGLVLFFAFLTLAGVLLGTSGGPGVSRPGSIWVAAVSFVLAGLCIWWAIHTEHRLRTRTHPDRPSDPDVEAARDQASRGLPGQVNVVAQRHGARHTRPPLRKHAPLTITFAFLVLAGCVFGVWADTISEHHAASQSTRVQNHGVPATGTVEHVQNFQHHGRASTWYTAQIDVVVADPVTNPRTTVVHYPHRSKLRSGDTVRVLVDPHDPRYAELPGEPSATTWDWVPVLFFAIAASLGLPFLGFAVVRQLLHRRARHGATPTVPSNTPAT